MVTLVPLATEAELLDGTKALTAEAIAAVGFQFWVVETRDDTVWLRKFVGK
jgi:hypothetical protein